MVFLSAVFGDRRRNISRSLMCHKIEIFLYQISRNLGKMKTFIFENFREFQLRNAAERWFWVIFSVVFDDRQRNMEEAQCAIKWKFFKNKISRKLGKTITFIFENFREFQLGNGADTWVLGVFQSVFDVWKKSLSRSPMYHKMDIFKKFNFEKIKETKTFILENFSECQLKNTVEGWILSIFECGFRGSTEEHVKNPNVP